MEEIKIWSVDSAGASQLTQADAVSSELLLEKTLVSHPDLLLPGLKLVGRQTPTEGGPLDLLGVDEDGRLVVFELKRGTLSRDAVAQVIDYASHLDSLDDDALASFIARNSGKHGIDLIEDFQDWYAQNTEADGLDALRPIRAVLVGLGVDERTERMVRFLANNSRLDISLLTFHGFVHGDKTLLARQARVEGTGSSGEARKARRQIDREEIRVQLHEKAQNYGLDGLFDEVNQSFRRIWNNPREKPRNVGLGFFLGGPLGSGRPRAYARVDPERSGVRVVFYPRSIELCPNKFQEAIEDTPFETYPSGRASNPFEPGTEIWFKLTEGNWETHKKALAELARSVYEALQKKNQGSSSSEADFEHDDDDDE